MPTAKDRLKMLGIFLVLACLGFLLLRSLLLAWVRGLAAKGRRNPGGLRSLPEGQEPPRGAGSVALQASETSFRVLAEAMPQIVWITRADGWNTFFNEQWVTYTGLTHEESHGFGWSRPFHPEHKARAEAAWKHAVENQGTYALECPLRAADGSYRWFLIRGVPHLDAHGEIEQWFGTCTDIHHLKLAEEALRTSQARQRATFENAGVGISLMDSNGRYVEVNARFAEFLGYEQEALLQLTNRDVTHPEDLDLTKRCFQALLNGETVSTVEEKRYVRKDGRVVWGLLSLSTVRDAQGVVQNFIGMVSDISDRKLIEDAIKDAKDAAEAANRAKSQFLANMSHEIRTPMNGILGLSSLALGQELSPKLRDYVTKIHAASRALLSIINDILDYSKVEAGRLELEAVAFNLDHLLEDVSTLFEHGAEHKDLELAIEIQPEVPLWLVGDPLRLGQVLNNLVGNAIKFTEAGLVQVKVASVAIEAGKATLRFSVRDTGIGMSPQHLKALFQAFTQADGSITRRFGGTGLGLTISQRLVKLMGGEIGVDSVPGEGSVFCFQVCFPVAEDPGQGETLPARGPDGQVPAPLGSAGIRHARILLVEDNLTNQLVAADLLEQAGVDVSLASNGQEALEVLAQGSFDAVLMDVQMPVLDGLEATRRIRQDLGLTKLPVIAMTAGVLAEDLERCRAAGMNDHILKPFEPDVLATKLEHWIRLAGGAGLTLDAMALEALFKGNPESRARFLATHRKSLSDLLAAIREAIRNGDTDQACRAAHAIKGMNLMVSCPGVREAALELEGCLRQGAAWLDQGRSLEALLVNLLQVIPVPPASEAAPPGPPPASVGPEALAQVLTELDQTLRRRSLDARLGVARLRLLVGADERVLLLEEAVNQMDFKEASRMLAQWAGVAGDQSSCGEGGRNAEP